MKWTNNWTRLPAVVGPRSELPMTRHIAVGFGQAGYSRDGEPLWEESQADDYEDFPTVQEVENLACADPDHDWRIYFHAPLYAAEYQRQWKGVWVLVSQGPGFA